MYHMPSKRRRFWRRLLSVTAMWVVVVSGVTVLTALTLGYSFDNRDRKIEQNGIMQIGSTPDGADVTINDALFSSKTPGKLVDKPGNYALKITRDAYQPWQKSVPIRPGAITWVTYPKLVPEDLTAKSVAKLPATLADGLSSGNSHYYAFLEKADSPNITIADISSDEVKTSRTNIPESIVVAPTPEAPKSVYSLVAWSSDEHSIVLKHVYGKDDSVEWIWANLQDPSQSVNLTTMFALPLDDISLSSGDGRQMYAVVNHAVRRLNLDEQTISRPLVENVAKYRLYGDGYILFTRLPVAGKQDIGYTRSNFTLPRTLMTTSAQDGQANLLDIGKYYDTYYALVSRGNEATLYKMNMLPLQVSDKLVLQPIQKFILDHPIVDVNITDNGQLATVQDGASFATYNLEDRGYAKTKIEQDAKQVPQKLKYLSTYMFWGSNNGVLRSYEFDGANQHDITPFDPRFDATFSPSGKYLYAVAHQSDGGYSLNRVQFLDLPTK